MKRVILLISLAMVFFCSCSNSKKDEEASSTELEQAIIKAQNSDIIETDLFLGFKFGMTEKDVYAHIKKLKDEGKVYLEDNEYKYTLTLDGGYELYLNFAPVFYEDRLYKMEYPISSKLGSTNKEYIFARSSFGSTKRYSLMKSFITKDALGDPVYTSIKDNLIITFDNISNSSMTYTNAPVAKIVEEKEKDVTKKKSDDAKSEF